MSDATQTAKNPSDARQASMSRVVTHESLLAKLTPQQPASEAAPKAETPKVEEPKPEAKEPEKQAKDDANKDAKPEAKPEGDQPRKKTAQERIHALADERRQAEAKAEAAERRSQELEAELRALRATAKPLEVDDRPVRSKFTTDDEYIDALTDWKAKQAIAQREQEQLQARIDAEQAEIAAQWSRRQDAVMKAFPDYADVIGKSEVSVPEHIHRAILESELGPKIAYYLALNQDEAKRLGMLRPVNGIKRIVELERQLADLEREQDEPTKQEPKAESREESPKVPKSKAPEPIDPPRSVPSTTPAASSSYAEYKARRQAQQRDKKAA